MLVNRVQGREISYRRGLSQGDPLSLLIFVLLANGLHHMIAIYRKAGLIEGLGCRDSANSVVNLHYADDNLIFGKDYTPQAMILEWILFYFKRWSRLKINFHKGALVFPGEIFVNSFLFFLVFNCPIQILPLSYLGLLLAVGSLKKRSGDRLLIRCRKTWQVGKGKCSLLVGGSL